MILNTFEKQPAEVKDYDIDYAPWLDAMGDTLNEIPLPVVECLTDPDDTALVCREVLHTTTLAKFWMVGGTPGNTYKLTALAETVAGRTDESELIFKIKDY